MEWWKAAILGIVEGITEYLPVSSTGHLILAERALGLHGEAANAFAICIQAGAIVAVLQLYRGRVAQGFAGVFGKDPDGKALTRNLIAAFAPAAVLGLLFDDLIEELLFGLWPVVTAWAVGGVGILAWTRLGRPGALPLEQLGWRAAFLIGLAQCVAMWPGTSRSLVTILAGMMVGLTLPAAVEFAFLLGLVTLGASTCYAGIKHADVLWAEVGPVALVVGFATAWLSAALAVKWMVGWLQKHGLELFAWWRLALAGVVAAALAAGVLQP
jgi:undecaprenyl-diphosphatase